MTDSILSLQNQFDSILFKEGCFSSITWLLNTGQLDYADYEQWRQGEIRYLEDHFKIPIQEIVDELETLHRYAKRLKLDSSLQIFSSVMQHPLNVCRSRRNERLLNTVFEPARNRIQTDLFLDSAPALAARDLIGAIADRRKDEIPGLLAKLKSFAPDRGTKFERLLEERDQFEHFPETGSKIEYLQNTLTPSAFEVLGASANDFLVPYWRELLEKLSGRAFDFRKPDEHSSFTAFRAYRWHEVLAAIENEKNWQSQPVLVFRFAEACFKTNWEIEGLENWFRLFLQFPEDAAHRIGESANFLLTSDWHDFNELDPELATDLFPAWLVMKRPALAKIGAGFASDSRAERAFQLMRDLATRTKGSIDESTVTLRTKLREQNPELFAHYMAENRSGDSG